MTESQARGPIVTVMCAVALLATAAPCAAAETTWTGDGDGVTFELDANWDLLLAPGFEDIAIFEDTGGSITVSSSPTTLGLNVENTPVVLGLSGFTYTVTEILLVGDKAAEIGDLTIQGGTMNVPANPDVEEVIIGKDPKSDGRLTVGAAATLFSGGEMFVGKEGTGTLTTAGGTIQGNAVTVADATGAAGSISLDGATMTVGQSLVVGNAGNGTLEATNGSTLTSDGGFIGDNPGSSGSVTISGSSWSVADALDVGDAQIGTLLVDQTGTASASIVRIGDNAGADGTVTVDGAGSSLEAGQITIGNGGTGALDVTGGSVSTTTAFVGDDLFSNGTVTVSGSGSLWLNLGEMTVGNEGTGALSILGGGSASSGAGVMRCGDGFSASGSITVDGIGSSLTRLGETVIGNFGTGDLAVTGGATLGTSRIKLADEIGSSGTAVVSGAFSAWNDSVEIFVGDGGVATLTVTAGGTINGVAGTIGDDLGADGTATVSGPGSTWSSTALLTVGDVGTGALNLEGGGVASAAAVDVGFAAGSSGAVTVSGAGSRLESGGGVRVGVGGAASLTIENGGAVEAGGAYTQSGTASLAYVLGSDSASGAGITASSATLSGSLTLSLAGGYVPPNGTIFTLVSAGSVSGSFAPVNAPPEFAVDVTPTAVIATYGGGGPATGACCFLDGTCSVATEADCLGAGGAYQGDATACGDVDCPQPPDCPSDITGDGSVDVQDLVEVILAWGPCDACAADVNHDGAVDVQDLVQVILDWGQCPA